MTLYAMLMQTPERQESKTEQQEVKPFDGLSDSQVAAVDEQIDLMEEA